MNFNINDIVYLHKDDHEHTKHLIGQMLIVSEINTPIQDNDICFAKNNYIGVMSVNDVLNKHSAYSGGWCVSYLYPYDGSDVTNYTYNMKLLFNKYNK